MSNRRRLPSEKARRPRCKKCNGREFMFKVYADHRERVCQTCEDIAVVPLDST